MHLNFTAKLGHIFSISKYADPISLADISDSNSASISLLFYVIFILNVNNAFHLQPIKSLPRELGHPHSVDEMHAAIEREA